MNLVVQFENLACPAHKFKTITGNSHCLIVFFVRSIEDRNQEY